MLEGDIVKEDKLKWCQKILIKEINNMLQLIEIIQMNLMKIEDNHSFQEEQELVWEQMQKVHNQESGPLNRCSNK